MAQILKDCGYSASFLDKDKDKVELWPFITTHLINPLSLQNKILVDNLDEFKMHH